MTADPSVPGLLVRPFGTVLVANRGEIAVRVIRSARDSGYRTVAVHSDADAGAPHVRAADVAVRIGPAPARRSYLDVDAILAAAAATGADAVHPGYGFLAENAAFAQACTDAGLVFVGPPPDAITLMGDKAAAKRRMAAAGVPMLPGYEGEAQDDDHLAEQAAAIGYPLMVKAAAGGGGKGMRLVTDPADLAGALAAARREAASAFGDDTLLLERALVGPRHVEVQVLADAHGTVLALGERDCSVQRRHQKVVEEAPSPVLDADVRAAMQQAAVTAATEIGYVGAGTVEFLLDAPADGGTPTFAFLEMNTRLQVEHPVTELVTGLDLVDWQLRVASGERLGMAQPDVALDGHAIEVRLYAEDPAAGYLPQTGRVLAWQPPAGAGVRVDAGIDGGQEVTAHYDPMLAKLIAHGRDREQARRRLLRAVESTVLLGPRTNRAFLAAVLDDPVFAAGEATTAFLADGHVRVPAPTDDELAAVAAWLHLQREAEADRRSPGLAGWSSTGRLRSHQRLQVGEAVHDVDLVRTREGLQVSIGDRTVAVTSDPGGSVDGVVVDGRTVRLAAVRVGMDRVLARLPRVDLDVVDLLLAPAEEAGGGGAGVLTAPMHGAVVATPGVVGHQVERGDAVVVIEAMKMEHVVAADVGGTLVDVATVGTQVGDGDVVARIDPGTTSRDDAQRADL